jgi:hypothetical protein
VKDWFNNHTRDSSAGDGRRAVLDLSMKKSKTLPDWQAYSVLYYETKVMATANEQWPAEREKLLERKANGEKMKGPPAAAPLWFRNKLVMAAFQNETQEVKDEVENFRKSLPEDFLVDEDVTDPEERKRLAKAIAINRWVTNSHIIARSSLTIIHSSRAQTRVPQTLVRALQQLKEQTGYIGFIALAGPDGQREGEIKTLSYVFQYI